MNTVPSNVFSFSGQKCNLELELEGPGDRASCIEDDPTALWLGSTGVHWCQGFVPQSQKVGITIAFKTLSGIRLEVQTQLVSFLQVANQIENCLTMCCLWIGWVLDNLMSGIHNVWMSGLGQVVELASHGPIIEVKSKCRFIFKSM